MSSFMYYWTKESQLVGICWLKREIIVIPLTRQDLLNVIILSDTTKVNYILVCTYIHTYDRSKVISEWQKHISLRRFKYVNMYVCVDTIVSELQFVIGCVWWIWEIDDRTILNKQVILTWMSTFIYLCTAIEIHSLLH